jgi:F-type H+-transporting ATPase subunit delta
MNDSKISVRYAKALFQSSRDIGITGKVMRDLEYIAGIIQTEDFKCLMRNPVIKTSKKKNIVINIIKENVEKLTFNFITLIIQHKREDYLDRIIRYFNILYKENEGIKSAEIIVPVKVDKDILDKFRIILTDIFGAKIDLTQKVKPGIIGGFILKVEDEQLDASVSTALSKMKESLI